MLCKRSWAMQAEPRWRRWNYTVEGFGSRYVVNIRTPFSLDHRHMALVINWSFPFRAVNNILKWSHAWIHSLKECMNGCMNDCMDTLWSYTRSKADLKTHLHFYCISIVLLESRRSAAAKVVLSTNSISSVSGWSWLCEQAYMWHLPRWISH